METTHKGQHEGKGHYGRLFLMTEPSFVAMFILMYAMVDRFANGYANFNQGYMAGLMAAPWACIRYRRYRSGAAFIHLARWWHRAWQSLSIVEVQACESAT